ncbi:hypothetical protein F5Y05DRAFT_416809 [Hypoxylon sp. FL0543]|nr:hypothetical protein F5Y05DRAFT_416809 [Hypoxylon sp. FL0543]
MRANNDNPFTRNAACDDPESSQLLVGSSQEELGRGRMQIITSTRIYVFILHCVAFVLSIQLWRTSNPSTVPIPTSQGRTWSPVHDFVEYEINGEHATNHEKYSKYSGPPSREQETAWAELVKPAYFNASLAELNRAGESVENAAELTEGGFLAAIGVYHELHCLRQLRFYLYKDHYYPRLTDDGEKYLHGHLDHCLESLRLTIMCHGNPSVYSFVWDKPVAIKPATKSNSRSVCVKWKSIESWALSRMVATDPELRRP